MMNLKKMIRREEVETKLAEAQHPKSDALNYEDLKHLRTWERDAIMEARAKRERRANRK